MTEDGNDMKALAQAFDLFTQSTHALEEAHRLLEDRARVLSDELAAKNQELALTNDYLNYILESMSDGVITVDPSGIITKFNRSAALILGYSSEEAVGLRFRDLFDREFVVPPHPSLMRLRSKAGRTTPVSERNAPIHDRFAQCIGHVKVFQDLSEIESLRQQLRQVDRLALIGEMAATVAHEIRNPLGGIRGFASLLAQDIPSDDPRSRLVEKILVGVKNLNSVVNELLEYTRPVEIDPKPVNCAELVDAALAYLDMGPRDIKLINDVPRDLIIIADPDKLRQVFLNILLNAVQSIEKSGDIRVSTLSTTDTVSVVITDTGCGIATDVIEKVFSPFYSTKEKGTGLGLAVAAKIVEGHTGSLSVHSEPGRGSTFSVCLPRMV